MNKLFSLILIAAAFAACNSPKSDEGSKEEAPVKDTATEAMVETPSTGFFGDTITEEGAISPDELLAAMEGQDSMQVKLSTTINSCCQKKGCWMKLDMGEGNPEMRVRFKDYGFFVPMDSDGKNTIVEGWAFKDTTSVEDLKHYAEDAGKSEEEIAAITEPEVSLAFMANGVIIK